MSKIEEQVIKKIRKRAEAGLEKYGTTMERIDLTEQEWLQHAQEEALDLAVYLERILSDKAKPSFRVSIPVDEILKVIRHMDYIIDEFEMDFVVDGELVDNPDDRLVRWHQEAKIARTRLRNMANYTGGL